MPTKRRKPSNIKAVPSKSTANIPNQTATDDTDGSRRFRCSAASSRRTMEAYFGKCQEKLGFVPNVLAA